MKKILKRPPKGICLLVFYNGTLNGQVITSPTSVNRSVRLMACLSVGRSVCWSVSFNKRTMPNKLLKELQAKFKIAERENKAPEEKCEKIELDFMETNEDSEEIIAIPPILVMQNSNNEVIKLSEVSALKKQLQKQFKVVKRDSKDEKENREKTCESITRELVQIKEAVRHPLPVSLLLSLPLPLSLPGPAVPPQKLILQQAQMELVR